MATVKEFRPETKFVLEHWEDVQLLVEALDQAKTDVASIVEAAQAELRSLDWFDEDAWETEGEGKRGFYALKKKGWAYGDDVFCLGVYDVSLDAMMSDDPTAWSYVWAPPKARTDNVRERVRRAADDGGLKGKSTTQYPFYRTFSLANGRSDPGKLREIVLGELDTIAKVMVPVIDEIVVRGPVA